LKIITKNIDHLGIVSAICDVIGLVEEIDKIIGVSPLQKVTTGEAVKMMVLNALGFVSRPLYMYPEYIENKSMCQFFRPELVPEDFNDDTIGRALDRIYEHDPTHIFMVIAHKVTKILGIFRKFVHFDTTTFTVDGEYDFDEDDMQPIKITYGLSKDGHFDLKQFVISLITTSKADLPIWVAALNGNSSDKKHFVQIIKDYTSMLKDNDEEIYYVMDSAFYSEYNVKTTSAIAKWISRVPETISEASEVIVKSDTEYMVESQQKGYKIIEHFSQYGDVDQKWVLVFSQQAYERELKTLKKNIKKEKAKVDKELWHLGNKGFNCSDDGIFALEKLCKKWKYHKIKCQDIVIKTRSNQRGRPRKDITEVQKLFFIKGTSEENLDKVSIAESKLGKFILATNDLNLMGDEILTEYKAQQSVERGFRFIKDPMFFTSSVFLKSPRRIVSLVMIMALGLLVYSIGQYKIRTALATMNETILNQVKKPTQKPTLRWVFQIFEGLHLVSYEENLEVKYQISNLKEKHKQILKLLGPTFEKTYLLS
jgi:transposase